MRRPLVLLGFVAAVIALVVPAAVQAAGPTKLDAFIYVDTVNGTRPTGAKPRPIGCTQSNVFTRGEQMVFRVWGTDAATGDVLSTENVSDGYVTFPGMANQKRARRDVQPRLVLDGPGQHPGRLPARHRHGPRRLQDRRRQDRDLRLPVHDRAGPEGRHEAQGQAREQGREPLKPAGELP